MHGFSHVQLAAMQQPRKAVPGGALERGRTLRKALGALHHLPVPCPGEPSQKQPDEGNVTLVLVVPSTLPQTQGDNDTLP
eukprot:2803815-Rhodomonas_salina.1